MPNMRRSSPTKRSKSPKPSVDEDYGVDLDADLFDDAVDVATKDAATK